MFAYVIVYEADMIASDTKIANILMPKQRIKPTVFTMTLAAEIVLTTTNIITNFPPVEIAIIITASTMAS